MLQFFILSEGLLTLDSFNRSNFELLTRLNRMSGRNQSLYPESNRRYSSNPAPDYMQRSMGTLSEHHFPDPLFGSAINAANAMPSDFEREKLSTEGFRERAHSISSSNTDYAAMPTEYDRQKLSTEASYRDRSQSLAQNTPYFSRQQLPSAHQDVKAYHQSLSDFGFNDNDMFDEDVAMHHQSLPDFAMSMPAQFGSERIKHSQDDDPIPFRHIRMPGRKHIKTTGECVELNKPPRPQSIDELQISMSQAAKYSTGKISKDLMECLDKMTYHNLSDDNPFEPVPLAPQQEKAHALQKQTAAARTNPHEETTPVDAFGDNPLLDESECDEFAEA